VHSVATSGQFGSTTRAINGGLECTPNGDTNKARQRWNRFNQCLQANGEMDLGQKEGGCYWYLKPSKFDFKFCSFKAVLFYYFIWNDFITYITFW
jgi:hypothetical protein